MDRRMIGVGVLGAGIVLAVIGVLSHAWITVGDGDNALGFGLRSIEACRSGVCRSISLTETPVDDLFSMSGNVAFFGALIASALGVVAGGLTLTRTTLNAPVSPARLSIAFFGAAAVAGLVYLGTKPGELGAQAHLGYAPFLAIGGCLLGAGGALAVYRHEQLAARELAARANTFT